MTRCTRHSLAPSSLNNTPTSYSILYFYAVQFYQRIEWEDDNSREMLCAVSGYRLWEHWSTRHALGVTLMQAPASSVSTVIAPAQPGVRNGPTSCGSPQFGATWNVQQLASG